MTAAPVLMSRDARGVVQVVLNRPEVNNAYDSAMIDSLLNACANARAGAAWRNHGNGAEAASAPADRNTGRDGSPGGDVRVVVLSGRGRHFQAGADPGWLNAVRPGGDAVNLDASERTARAVWELNTLPVPTVALIQGACFGGGTGIVPMVPFE